MSKEYSRESLIQQLSRDRKIMERKEKHNASIKVALMQKFDNWYHALINDKFYNHNIKIMDNITRRTLACDDKLTLFKW